MRFIHTSDWHLGHRLYGLNRVQEQSAFLDWLIDQVQQHQIDALIVAGDIFDTHNPSAEATRLYYRFLHQLHHVDPHVQVVIIGGNHDSAQRLDAPREVLSALGVHVVGGLPTLTSPQWQDVYVPLSNREGKTVAWVAAIPFLRSSDLPIVTSEPEERMISGVREVYHHALTQLQGQIEDDQAVILTGHCQMSRGVLSQESERQVPGYGDASLPSDVFSPEGNSLASYVALGHLHLAQQVSGCDWIRYSGSPLAFSISESHYPHQVLLVELEGRALSSITPLLVPESIKLKMIRIPDHSSTFASDTERGDQPRKTSLPLKEALKAIKALPPLDDTQPDWQLPLIQVNIECDAPDPTIKAKVLSAIEGKHARLAKISISYPGRTLRPSPEAPTQHLRDIDPDDVFRARWLEKRGEAPPEDLLEVFRMLKEEARVSLEVNLNNLQSSHDHSTKE